MVLSLVLYAYETGDKYLEAVCTFYYRLEAWYVEDITIGISTHVFVASSDSKWKEVECRRGKWRVL